jgi:ubiquinone/menaquinone biosynthesis C-methylase UbiE
MAASGEDGDAERVYGRTMKRAPGRGIPRSVIEAAARARIEELVAAHGNEIGERRKPMTTEEQIATPAANDAERELKAATRAAWALGDYHAFAKATVWELGERLVEACGIGPGQRVLDVAAGTGNTAIRAAQAGADVVASDLTPENFESGRAEAAEHGVELEWVEADAEALPFDDGEFDAVTSSVGALFAPHHQRVADEMLRVCRPGGTIGMLNFAPDGLIADFFGALAPYMPPAPDDALPPPLWGDPDHVRELFGDRVASLELRPGSYIERAASPDAYVELFKRTFGPVVATYESLAGDSERRAAFDRDFLEFATRTNTGPDEGPAEYRYDYVTVLARKRVRVGSPRNT